MYRNQMELMQSLTRSNLLLFSGGKCRSEAVSNKRELETCKDLHVSPPIGVQVHQKGTDLPSRNGETAAGLIDERWPYPQKAKSMQCRCQQLK